MSDHEASAYCQEKFRQYDAHLAESVPFRTKVDILDASLGFLVKSVESFKSADFSIKMSLVGIVFAIIVQVGGFLYLWGEMNSTVKTIDHRVFTLEEMHPRAK